MKKEYGPEFKWEGPPMPLPFVFGFDPYKRIKWYHRVMKFFGFKVKTGTMTIFKKLEGGGCEVISTRTMYL